MARVKQLRDRNIAIGREMVAIDTEPVLADESGKSSPTVWNPTTGKFESESGVVAGDEAAGGIYANRKARKEQLARELQENERLLEELNSMIGGSFKGEVNLRFNSHRRSNTLSGRNTSMLTATMRLALETVNGNPSKKVQPGDSQAGVWI